MNFSAWHQYFLANRNHFDHIDWTDNQPLSDMEKRLITSSIQQFQRGEYSEGKHFMEFAQSLQDSSYVDTVRIFIKEEQDHAAVLGKFMDKHTIAKLRNDWLDNVFRKLRKLAGLEGTITVLLTAETISMIYYKALFAATASPALRQICKQILVDEKMHLRFQSYSLQLLYQQKNFISLFISKMIHTILMAGTILMVWFYHKKVLKAGGYHFFSCFREIWKEFNHCSKMIGGKETSSPVSANINHAA